MRNTSLFSLILDLVVIDAMAIKESQQINCDDIKNINAIGKISVDWFNSNESQAVDVKFYLTTRYHKEPVEINFKNLSQLHSSQLDPLKRTYVIVHGYSSSVQKPWVLQMNNALADYRDGNVIMIDWSDGSCTTNYVNAAKNTIIASNRIYDLFQLLRLQVHGLRSSSDQILWNHLHFIGHSLGVQVIAQTAHFLKDDEFWKIERITGLDPTKQCFTNVVASLRLDKMDADFVDIAHTNIGKNLADSLGFTEVLGHVDFYVNGGILQPACLNETFSYQKMLCSHSKAHEYFTESIKTNNGALPIQRWNGSYLDAQVGINFSCSGLTCHDCPKFGIDAVHTRMRGVFLVLAGSSQPYCKIDANQDIEKLIPGILELKSVKSIFERTKPAEGEFPFLTS